MDERVVHKRDGMLFHARVQFEAVFRADERPWRHVAIRNTMDDHAEPGVAACGDVAVECLVDHMGGWRRVNVFAPASSEFAVFMRRELRALPALEAEGRPFLGEMDAVVARQAVADAVPALFQLKIGGGFGGDVVDDDHRLLVMKPDDMACPICRTEIVCTEEGP